MLLFVHSILTYIVQYLESPLVRLVREYLTLPEFIRAKANYFTRVALKLALVAD